MDTKQGGDEFGTEVEGVKLVSRSTDAEYRSNLASHIVTRDAEQGVVNIKFKRVVGGVAQKVALSADRYTGLPAVDAVLRSLEGNGSRSDSGSTGVTVTRLFEPSAKHEAKHIKHGLDLWYEVRFDPQAADLMRASALFLNLDEIEYVETVKPTVLIGGEADATGEVLPEGARVAGSRDGIATVVNDPFLGKQWHYDAGVGSTVWTAPNAKINLFKAWRKTAGDRDVIVAIIDGGIKYDHEDLAANMWTNTGEIPNNSIDDDGNGLVDDVHGYNFGNQSADIKFMDHGTHVGGTVGAVNNNGVGLCGVAGGTGKGDGVRLMTCDIFGGGSNGREARALIYAADNGAIIAQNSWGYDQIGVQDKAQEEAILYFIKEAGNATDFPDSPMRGGIAIFASGNLNSGGYYYPAAYDFVVAVSSINNKGVKSTFSNYGDYIDITAPGGGDGSEPGIWSTVPSGYGSMPGTSMACPHVSGVAALLVAANKGTITPDKLRTMLLESVVSLKDTEPAYFERLGSGSLDASKHLYGNDMTAPDAAVVSLVEPERNGLSWLVPGDRNDPVNGFTVYYSLTPFTAISADAVANGAIKTLSIENAAEAKQTVTLLFGDIKKQDAAFNADINDYYFAVTATDVWGNVSPLSNVVEYAAITVADDQAGMSKSVVGHDGKVRLVWGRNVTGAKRAMVVDASGRTVRNIDLGNVDSIRFKDLDLRGLASGNYIVKVVGSISASTRFRKL